jgi:uncharacterized membrane protein YccC
MSWLRRKDPQYRALRRAARVALVACLAFYFCRYVLGDAKMAPYALFGAVALGALSQIPGSPKQRAATIIAVLPVGWLLVSLGTLLSITTWSATLGMFVLGFVLSFVGVGGPRLVGLAAGMQLLYILPCFPPYDPGSLIVRLEGLTLALVMLAIAELFLWPDPTPPPYSRRLGDSLSSLAGCLSAVADSWDGDPNGRTRLADLVPTAADLADQLRPSRMPPVLRPASAGRRDRALSSAAGTARLMLGRTVDMSAADAKEAINLPASTRLLREAAECAEAASAWLRGAGPLPETEKIVTALSEFRVARMNADPNGRPSEQLHLSSMALSTGEFAKQLVFAIRIAAGVPPEHADPTPVEARPGAFWFAYHKTPELYWHRLKENLTPRSVAFQGALRLAVALAVARLLAGELDLSHGFWVLLTILTVLRTSAAETRSTLRPALVGTVGGSIAAAVLLLFPLDPLVYIIALPIVTLVGFAAGPLFGLGWGQALFTLVITLVFAQVTPVDWRIAEVRVLDVLLGAAIGVLIGLFAWPRGGGGELYRAVGTFIATGGEVIRETIGVMAEGKTPGTALPQARRAGQLAEASFALYQSEQHAMALLDWQATLISGHHAVRGAETLIRSCPAGGLLPCVGPLTVVAADVAARYDRRAVAFFQGDEELARRPIPDPEPVVWPTDLGQDLYVIADLRVWLDGLREDIDRIGGTPERGDTVQERVAELADGAQ